MREKEGLSKEDQRGEERRGRRGKFGYGECKRERVRNAIVEGNEKKGATILVMNYEPIQLNKNCPILHTQHMHPTHPTHASHTHNSIHTHTTPHHHNHTHSAHTHLPSCSHDRTAVSAEGCGTPRPPCSSSSR
jgi:hypothetical protein